jgi:hypothetical protein
MQVQPQQPNMLYIGLAVVVVLLILVVFWYQTRPKATPVTQVVSAPVAPVVKRPFVLNDSNNKFTVEVCNSCGGPVEGSGAGAGQYSVILVKGAYTGEELAKHLQDRLNALFEQRTSYKNDWSVKYNSAVGNFSVQSIGKRAWWLVEDPNAVYKLMGIEDALRGPGKNWIWSGGEFFGVQTAERFTAKKECYVTVRDLALLNN